MSERLLSLAARIRDELEELDRLARRVAEGWGALLAVRSHHRHRWIEWRGERQKDGSVR